MTHTNNHDSSPEPDLLSLWSLLFEIVRDIEGRLAAFMAAHDLTPPQFYVLKTLTEQGGQAPIGEIAKAHHLTNATMTGIVKRLENMTPPLVERRRSETDRRSVLVALTPDGMAKFAAIQADLIVQVQGMLSILDADGQRDLLHYAAYYVNEVIPRFPVNEIGGEG